MKAATAPVRAFGSVIDSANARLAGFIGGLAGAAAVSAGVRFVKQQAEALDALGKTADQIGINVEALKAYEIGARKAGVESTALTSGFTKFSQAVSRAAAGEKEYADTFASLNLDPSVLINSGIDEALHTTADALLAVGNQTDRLAISTDLFGRTAGRSFLSFLEDGSEGLDVMLDDAKRLGAAFDRVDIAEVEAANDAFEDISIALENVGSVVAIKVAPFVTELSTRFAEAVAEGTKFGENVTAGLRMVAHGIAWVMDGWKVLNIAIKLSQATLLAWIDVALKGFNLVIKSVNAISKQLNKALPDFLQVGQIETLDPMIEAFEDQIKSIGDDIQKMVDEGWSHNKVDEWFDNIIAKSRMAAEARVNDNDMVGDSMRRLNDLNDQKSAQVSLSGALNYLRNVAAGRQINTAQVSGTRAMQQTQNVKDPQLQETNELLTDIRSNTRDAGTAVYA